jgi:hypothetical protein
MEIGTRFAVDGYDVVATMQAAEGPQQVVVMHNGSTHFLVAVQQLDMPEPPHDAELLASLRYSDDVADVYKAALTVACAEAVRR